MSSAVSIEPVAGRDLFRAEPVKKTPNVVDVGAWLSRAKTLREPTDYVPRHRRPGPAV